MFIRNAMLPLDSGLPLFKSAPPKEGVQKENYITMILSI